MLLLLNGSTQGSLVWSGPEPTRTVLIEPEIRVIRIT